MSGNSKYELIYSFNFPKYQNIVKFSYYRNCSFSTFSLSTNNHFTNYETPCSKTQYTPSTDADGIKFEK